MGKKSKQKEMEVPVQDTERKRPKLTAEEKRKLYIAGGLMIVMFIVGYFTIKSIFVTYDNQLGGDWQLKSIVLEETEHPYQEQIGLRLAVDDQKEGPEAVYELKTDADPVLTDEGEIFLPELGAYRVDVTVKELTVWPEVENVLANGAIDIYQEDGTQGIVKKLQAFTRADGTRIFCFGLEEEPVVSNFESTKRHVKIQFEPVNAAAQ